jgi:glycosyltransferase involved in cell wall biosynthesis
MEAPNAGNRMRLLVIAFHFPPESGSSGVLRTLKFVRYLPQCGVDPAVLTVRPKAYTMTNDRLLSQVPAEVPVRRCLAMDASRHLAWKGRHLPIQRVPDRYSSWIPTGILEGLRLIRAFRPSAIYSTYPIPSAHYIGYALARLTGLPWIADFRDPMWWDKSSWTESGLAWSARKWMEGAAMRRCAKAIVCTPGMMNLFQSRYPGKDAGKLTLIPNGYDEEDFRGIAASPRLPGAPLLMVHAGLLEREDRDPIPFFQAVRMFLDKGQADRTGLKIRFYGSGNDDLYAEEVRKLGIGDVVEILKAIPYHKVLQEMATADVLLLFQGPSCDAQVPAKMYEYMRIGKPILALTTRQGDTGRILLEARGGEVVPPDDPAAIAGALAEWVRRLGQGEPLPKASAEETSRYSRQRQAGMLGDLVRGVSGGKAM